MRNGYGGGVNNIQGTLANGMVKSVQRGVVKSPSFSGTYSVPISTVNTNRSLLIITHLGNDGSVNFTLNSSSFGIAYTGINNHSISNVSWQVIEFY